MSFSSSREASVRVRFPTTHTRGQVLRLRKNLRRESVVDCLGLGSVFAFLSGSGCALFWVFSGYFSGYIKVSYLILSNFLLLSWPGRQDRSHGLSQRLFPIFGRQFRRGHSLFLGLLALGSDLGGLRSTLRNILRMGGGLTMGLWAVRLHTLLGALWRAKVQGLWLLRQLGL